MKYLVENDGRINGYFEDLTDAVLRHISLGDKAKIYKAIEYRFEVTDLQSSDTQSEVTDTLRRKKDSL